MPRSLAEIESLKRGWSDDPCWDIEGTEGFEEHREDLLAYRHQCEAEWVAKQTEREIAIDVEAERLGLRGIYRRLLAAETELGKLRHASAALCGGEQRQAWNALRGFDT